MSGCAVERVQIDLVDMRHQPDRQYEWILHAKDHCSKFSCLKSKQAEGVADNTSLLSVH
jgi:hypothetical protein